MEGKISRHLRSHTNRALNFDARAAEPNIAEPEFQCPHVCRQDPRPTSTNLDPMQT